MVEIAADLRFRSSQFEPRYSTRLIIESCFEDTLVTGRHLPAGVLEAVSRTPDGPVIVYSRSLPPPHQRYAIAHALGHLLFDGPNAFRQPGQCLDVAAEARADAFADELLVPLRDLAAHVDIWPSDDPVQNEIYLDSVDEIASEFGVLSDVIQRRVRMLGLQVRTAA